MLIIKSALTKMLTYEALSSPNKTPTVLNINFISNHKFLVFIYSIYISTHSSNPVLFLPLTCHIQISPYSWHNLSIWYELYYSTSWSICDLTPTKLIYPLSTLNNSKSPYISLMYKLNYIKSTMLIISFIIFSNLLSTSICLSPLHPK